MMSRRWFMPWGLIAPLLAGQDRFSLFQESVGSSVEELKQLIKGEISKGCY